MPTRTITLAEPAAQWIDDRVRNDGYPNADAYIAALVERERKDAEKLTALHAALDEGERSGVSPYSVEQVFANARARHARAG